MMDEVGEEKLTGWMINTFGDFLNLKKVSKKFSFY